MGLLSRNKGKRGEREAASVLQRLFRVPAKRTSQRRGDLAADIDIGCAVHVEVKRRAKIGAIRFLEQAERDAQDGEIPLIMLREDGDTNWSILCRVENLTGVMRELERTAKEQPTRADD
tara:strand:- start:409 stop:765 length:357 start_codon:yes stop_codon:yes gene_type:complete